MSSASVDQKTENQTMQWVRLICCGLCMGTADIIPGISGGTIAFIMGFYEELLNSIKSFNLHALKQLSKGHFREFFKLISWKFLLGLISGIVVAMVCLAHLVTYILNHENYRIFLYASFFGLIVAAAFLCSQQLKSWKWSYIIIFVLSASMAYIFSGKSFVLDTKEDLFNVKVEFKGTEKPLNNYDADSQMLLKLPKSTVSAMLAKGVIHNHTYVYSFADQRYGKVNDFIKTAYLKKLDGWIIFCGAIAICAMILPGISGSYLLSILGVYATVVGALADFAGGLTHAHLDIPALMILTNMLIGIFLGAIFFTRFVSWVLNKYHDIAIIALTGFMIGALKSVWPFWTYQYTLLPLNLSKGPQLEVTEPYLPSLDPQTFLAISLALAGALIVITLNKLAHFMQMKNRAYVNS